MTTWPIQKRSNRVLTSHWYQFQVTRCLALARPTLEVLHVFSMFICYVGNVCVCVVFFIFLLQKIGGWWCMVFFNRIEGVFFLEFKVGKDTFPFPHRLNLILQVFWLTHNGDSWKAFGLSWRGKEEQFQVCYVCWSKGSQDGHYRNQYITMILAGNCKNEFDSKIDIFVSVQLQFEE